RVKGVSDMIFDKLKTIIAEQFGVEESSITTDLSFEDDLGADSVDIVELSMALEEEFEVEEMSEEDVTSIHTVGDLLKYLQDRLEDN
ncbi:MAG: acyl carrier protein, partial [Oscillospiraceae bacterium]